MCFLFFFSLWSKKLKVCSKHFIPSGIRQSFYGALFTKHCLCIVHRVFLFFLCFCTIHVSSYTSTQAFYICTYWMCFLFDMNETVSVYHRNSSEKEETHIWVFEISLKLFFKESSLNIFKYLKLSRNSILSVIIKANLIFTIKRFMKRGRDHHYIDIEINLRQRRNKSLVTPWTFKDKRNKREKCEENSEKNHHKLRNVLKKTECDHL